MTFQEQLNLYMEELSCSGRELAQNSGNCPDCRAKRKENRSGKGFGGSFGSLEAGRKSRNFLLPKV